MTSLSECIVKYHLVVDKIKKTSHYTVLYGRKNYLWKEKDSSKKELFSYFESIGYPYYLPQLNDYNDAYELYDYFEDEIENSSLKGKRLIEVLSFLHSKSMYYEDINENTLQNIYEKIKKKIQDTQKYYEDLHNYIEQFSFPRVDYYLFINHASLFYRALFMAQNLLEEWYQSKPKKIHKSYVIHRTSLSNFCLHKPYYFIDYHECFYDYMIYDFVSFYQSDCLHVDMKSLFEQYDSSISLDYEEKRLLFCLLCIPKILNFSCSTYFNTVKITEEIETLNKIFLFVSEENKED